MISTPHRRHAGDVVAPRNMQNLKVMHTFQGRDFSAQNHAYVRLKSRVRGRRCPSRTGSQKRKPPASTTYPSIGGRITAQSMKTPAPPNGYRSRTQGSAAGREG